VTTWHEPLKQRASNYSNINSRYNYHHTITISKNITNHPDTKQTPTVVW